MNKKDTMICKFVRHDLKTIYIIKIRKFKLFWVNYKISGLVKEFNTKEEAYNEIRKFAL